MKSGVNVNDMRDESFSGALVKWGRLVRKEAGKWSFLSASVLPEPVRAVVVFSSWKRATCVCRASGDCECWMASETTEFESGTICQPKQKCESL